MNGGHRFLDYFGVRMSKIMLWGAVVLAIVVRVALVMMGAQVYLSRRVEVATPVNSPLRLAEGRWLKKLGLSPYAGRLHMWIGIPWLTFASWRVGSIDEQRKGRITSWGAPEQISIAKWAIARRRKVIPDLIGALLLRSIGTLMETGHERYVSILQLQQSAVGLKSQLQSTSNSTNDNDATKDAKLGLGNAAAVWYLLNPFTVAVCVGGTTSPLENLMVILSLYGAISGNIPLATFGWAAATHLSLYPVLLIIPILLLTVHGPDRPQRKVFDTNLSLQRQSDENPRMFSRRQGMVGLVCGDIMAIALWSAVWWGGIMALCYLAVDGHAQVLEMLTETYGFILSVPDLSPNLGLFWYFFTEVFTQFRTFFIMVFHANLLFAIIPLTVRLHHRPMFLAFIFVAVSTLLKSYPSVGDAALTLTLMSLCTLELTGFRYSVLVLYGYLLIAVLSPAMYDLWIWRGTGNANFYFAMALVYSILQSILIIESVGTVIRYDRKVKTSVGSRRLAEEKASLQHGKADQE